MAGAGRERTADKCLRRERRRSEISSQRGYSCRIDRRPNERTPSRHDVSCLISILRARRLFSSPPSDSHVGASVVNVCLLGNLMNALSLHDALLLLQCRAFEPTKQESQLAGHRFLLAPWMCLSRPVLSYIVTVCFVPRLPPTIQPRESYTQHRYIIQVNYNQARAPSDTVPHGTQVSRHSLASHHWPVILRGSG